MRYIILIASILELLHWKNTPHANGILAGLAMLGIVYFIVKTQEKREAANNARG